LAVWETDCLAVSTNTLLHDISSSLLITTILGGLTLKERQLKHIRLTLLRFELSTSLSCRQRATSPILLLAAELPNN
jgi:hypothetical protein